MKKLIGIMVIFGVLLWPYPAAHGVNSHAMIKRGTASWYSETDPGILKTTANMEIFDDKKLTCAIWDVPFDTLINVTNLDNRKSVIVRVNDRGPARRLVKQGRIIDLSKGAFSEIADPSEGLIDVNIGILE